MNSRVPRERLWVCFTHERVRQLDRLIDTGTFYESVMGDEDAGVERICAAMVNFRRVDDGLKSFRKGFSHFSTPIIRYVKRPTLVMIARSNAMDS